MQRTKRSYSMIVPSYRINAEAQAKHELPRFKQANEFKRHSISSVLASIRTSIFRAVVTALNAEKLGGLATMGVILRLARLDRKNKSYPSSGNAHIGRGRRSACDAQYGRTDRSIDAPKD